MADDYDPPPSSILEDQSQARIDKMAANGDVWSNRIWQRALVAVRRADGFAALEQRHRTHPNPANPPRGRTELADFR